MNVKITFQAKKQFKAFDSDVYKKCTGHDNLLILDNLRFLAEKNCKIEIRYPLVVGYNDRECDKIGAFLMNLKGITKIKFYNITILQLQDIKRLIWRILFRIQKPPMKMCNML